MTFKEILVIVVAFSLGFLAVNAYLKHGGIEKRQPDDRSADQDHSEM